MLLFTSPNLVGGRLPYALARKPNSHFSLIFTRGASMAADRESAILNFTTPHSEKLALSADKRPLIWLDSDIDRDERNLGPPGGMLVALLPRRHLLLRPRNGRKSCVQRREESGRRVLLSEEDLARICYHCGSMETVSDDRFERCGGQDHESLYWCGPCARQSAKGAAVSST